MSSADVTNAALADSLGVSQRVPTAWRNGKAPNVTHAVELAALLECDLWWLLTGQSAQPSPPVSAAGAAAQLRLLANRLRDLAEEAEGSAGSV